MAIAPRRSPRLHDSPHTTPQTTPRRNDDEGAVESGDPQEYPRTPPAVRTSSTVSAGRAARGSVFPRDLPIWVDSEGRSEFNTADEVEKALSELAFNEFCGTPFNGLRWRPVGWKTLKDGTRTNQYRCGFNHAAGCEFRAKRNVNPITGATTFIIGTTPHTNHSQLVMGLRGVPPQVKASLSSPSLLRLKPDHFVARVAEKQIVPMTTAMRRTIKRWFSDCVKNAGSQHLNDAEFGTYGALAETLEGFRKKNLPSNSFTDRTTYLVGDRFFVDSEARRHWAVLSTEDMLLNAYRQLCTGQDMYIGVDTSYRLTVEGFALMPIMVVSPNQQGHRIAYACVSNEDEEMHVAVFRALRDGVEDVVNNRIERGDSEV